jgi:hypothetical protein
MIKITTAEKGYKLLFIFRIHTLTSRRRYILKRMFSGFEQCKTAALRFSKRINRTVLIDAEAEMRYKLTGA